MNRGGVIDVGIRHPVSVASRYVAFSVRTVFALKMLYSSRFSPVLSCWILKPLVRRRSSWFRHSPYSVPGFTRFTVTVCAFADNERPSEGATSAFRKTRFADSTGPGRL